jgi:cytochrome c oxidase subunit 3
VSSLRAPEYPRREQSFKNLSSAQMAMYIGLVSLGVFFAASLLGLFYTRAESSVWREGSPPPPLGLWVSTVLLLLLSASLRYGEAHLARNNRTALVRGLALSLGTGGAFLVAQIQNWRSMASALADVEIKSLYAFCFFFLTVLHALHVGAGMIPLVVVYRRAKRDEYSSSRSEGVRFARQYWDFLLVVWLVLLAALWF